METVFRVAAYYLFVLVGLRIMGKREFAQLSPLELVALLLIPEMIAQSIVREDFSFVNGIVAIATLFSLVYITTTISHLSPKAGRIVSSTPAVLIANGEYVTENMNRERVGPEDVKSEIHKAGLERIDQVKWAVLETDGKIAIIPFEQGSSSGNQPDEGGAV